MAATGLRGVAARRAPWRGAARIDGGRSAAGAAGAAGARGGGGGEAQKGHAIVYDGYGDPQNVLRAVEIEVPAPGNLQAGQVLVRMLAAPVNPSDINQIQGVYPIKPALPAVPGNEGVGRVLATGSGVTDVAVGDMVIPANAGSGTWRSHLVCAGRDLLRVPPSTSIELAATMTVNPSTAYRMLRDFVSLGDGDAVIQNAGNSAVGLAVIELARHSRIPTINVVRNRPDIEALRAKLAALGASVVVTEDELASPVVQADVRKRLGHPRIALGLNAVGGPATTDLLKWIDERGVLVTYGAMAKKPIVVPASALIFRDVALRGFWMTRWNQTQPLAARRTMLDDLAALERAGALHPAPLKAWQWSDFKAAVAASQEAHHTHKPLLVF